MKSGDVTNVMLQMACSHVVFLVGPFQTQSLGRVLNSVTAGQNEEKKDSKVVTNFNFKQRAKTS